jgi:hypothetical protein
MRAFNIFIIILNTMILFSIGLLLLGTSLSEGLRSFVFSGWQGYEVAVASGHGTRLFVDLAGLGMMALAISTVVGNLRNRRYERAVVFHNPHGEVMIALGALEDLGKAVKAEIPGLKDVKLRVLAKRKGIAVTARVSLWSDANLPKTTELIQESVRQYLQEIVGADQEIRPRVVVGKVAYRDPEEHENGGAEFRRRARRPVV